MRRLLLKNFRIADEAGVFFGSVIVEDGFIAEVIPHEAAAGNALRENLNGGNFYGIIDGNNFSGEPALMPAFIDLHAHFRDPGITGGGIPFPAETLESGSLAAAAGGYGTVVCMANTKPAIDTAEKARVLKERAAALGFIDLFPVVSLTKNMEGRELSQIHDCGYLPLMLSEDGKDIADSGLFLDALKTARTLGIPVSCHCDFGGPEAEAAKSAGRPRAEWSRIEENNAVRRAVDLGKIAGCHIHIAHVSTQEAAAFIRHEKKSANEFPGFRLTCEATPHHIGATENDAQRMGEESAGRVNPPLRTESDRQAIIAALLDGTIDAIATDHAPHSDSDKAAGMPGFTGLETAFAVCLSALAGKAPGGDLRHLSALMSANPARILGLGANRGRIAPGLRADIVIADTRAEWIAAPSEFKSRGKCGPFNGKKLQGKILMTLHSGRIVFNGGSYV